MMHSTSSDAQEYFWASLEQTIFDVQLVNFTPLFSPISIQEVYACCTLSQFSSKGSTSSARQKTSLVKPHFQDIRSNYSYFWEWNQIYNCHFSEQDIPTVKGRPVLLVQLGIRKAGQFFLNSTVALFLNFNTPTPPIISFTYHYQNLLSQEERAPQKAEIKFLVIELLLLLYTSQLMSSLRTSTFHLLQTRGLPVTTLPVQR